MDALTKHRIDVARSFFFEYGAKSALLMDRPATQDSPLSFKVDGTVYDVHFASGNGKTSSDTITDVVAAGKEV